MYLALGLTRILLIGKWVRRSLGRSCVVFRPCSSMTGALSRNSAYDVADCPWYKMSCTICWTQLVPDLGKVT
uniref:Putative secreted protein n=1 Tax=Ixodes ricinus TaxID=34613 RepID=A0A6B0U2Z7_IXORI